MIDADVRLDARLAQAQIARVELLEARLLEGAVVKPRAIVLAQDRRRSPGRPAARCGGWRRRSTARPRPASWKRTSAPTTVAVPVDHLLQAGGLEVEMVELRVDHGVSVIRWSPVDLVSLRLRPPARRPAAPGSGPRPWRALPLDHRRAHATPGHEAIRAHQDRALGADLSAAQPRAARVKQVAVDVPDPDRVDRNSRAWARSRAASHHAWPSSPAISRNRPGATRSLIGRRWPFSSSIHACGRGEPGRVVGS